MKDENPLVSAIIPTKNRSGLLRRAILSVMAQTYEPIEIIVVDDGSTDDTEAAVRALSQNIIYIKNENSQGAPKARNTGIKMANGVFIAGLDDDDEWHPERIEILLRAYDAPFSCVASDVTFQYKNGSAVWHKKKSIRLNDLLFSNQVGNQVIVKRDWLVAVGGFDESLEAAQDYDVWIRLCEAFGPVRNVRKALQIVHTEHGKGRISNPMSQLKGYLAFYKKHKSKMNRSQRKYQLYNIRRAQGKQQGLIAMLGWVPLRRYFKEAKRWITDRFLNG